MSGLCLERELGLWQGEGVEVAEINGCKHCYSWKMKAWVEKENICRKLSHVLLVKLFVMVLFCLQFSSDSYRYQTLISIVSVGFPFILCETDACSVWTNILKIQLWMNFVGVDEQLVGNAQLPKVTGNFKKCSASGWLPTNKICFWILLPFLKE